MSITQRFMQQAQPDWQHYVEHPFVQQLGNGTLPLASFQHYLIQDYHYLLHYSRALALAMYKSHHFVQLTAFNQDLQNILTEVQLHIHYCQQWQISKTELDNTPESPACVAYTRYMLDCGLQGGLAELYTAIAPCALGYAEIGKRLAAVPQAKNNPYQTWIDTYAAKEFQAAANAITQQLEQLCVGISPQQQQKLQHIFTTATRMEIAFWQMGLDRS
ncbi:thiaminase II [Gallibacterium anatis]|uniref:thiaminase II n=1 Tax=Gallibacterium anatis TaxID=750 RepID=UPI0039FC6A45